MKVLLKSRANIEVIDPVGVSGSVFWGMVVRVEDDGWFVQIRMIMLMGVCACV